MSFNTPLDNRTPFAAASFVLPDQYGQEVLLIVVAAAFVVGPHGGLAVAEDPPPIRVADEHAGDPAQTRTVYEADLAITKPFVEVLVNGYAYAPAGRPADRVTVRLRAGDMNKTLLVTGDRNRLGNIRPFTRMPIVYERAFGGIDERGRRDDRNPIGVGYGGAFSQHSTVQTAAPNVEYPDGSQRPAGFGAVGRGWKPRIEFAGTYDQRWVDERWPLLPVDFDPRHYQAAPSDQQSATLSGGDLVELTNLTRDGRWAFILPRLDVPVHLIYENRYQHARLAPDTVLIEPETHRLTLTSRLSVQTVRNAGVLRYIVVGHVTRAWLRATARRKLYVDSRGTHGADLNRPLFHLA